MINKDSILASVPLADEFAQQGFIIAAKPNTVVSELTRLSNSAWENQGQAIAVGDEVNTEYSSYADITERLTTGTLTDPSLHDRYLDSVIDDISAAVLKHITFAKNVVKPIVIDYIESVKQALSAQPSPNASSEFCIEVMDLPEILSDTSFLGTLDFYKNKTPLKPDLKIALGDKTADEIHQMLLTADKDTDAMIDAWYARKTPDFFLMVWESFFKDPKLPVTTTYVSFDDMMEMNVFTKADFALAIYLISNRLFMTTDDTSKDVSLSTYQNTMAQFRDFGAALLNQIIARVAVMSTTRTLVVEMKSNQHCCKVYGENYRDWLENGGSTDIILGLIVSKKNIFSQSLIDDAHEDLIQHWKSYCLFYNAADANKAFNRFKETLRQKFVELMATLTEAEQTFIQSNANYNTDVTKYLEEELEKLTPADTRDVVNVAMRIVCRTRFYYTDAEKILTEMNEAAAANPNIDVREAALIAMIQYVTDYVGDQLTKLPG